MELISRNDYIRWQEEGFALVPVGKKIRGIDEGRWFTLAEKWRKNAHFILLQSGRGGRYSYLAHGLFGVVKAKDGKMRIRVGDRERTIATADPLNAFKKEMERWKAPRLPQGPDWQGGAAGYLAYDTVRYFEKLPQRAADDLRLPDFYFLLYRDVIAYDHAEAAVYIVSNGFAQAGERFEVAAARVEELQRELTASAREDGGGAGAASPVFRLSGGEVLSFDKAAFIRAVEKVQEYIAAGDVFQVNLSIRQTRPLPLDPWSIYRNLWRINPSPYMAYLQFPEFQVVCGSPELLIKVQGRDIRTRPIAGTRPRGKDRYEDRRLAQELLANEKERAEHIMLVDLERNDLGRICRYGTVEVRDLMVIEEYSHVMHIVSSVAGELAADKDAYDAIRACFPGGTITGAPKVRTMEIIEELEPVRRGIYTGSIGWIGFNGDLELNIVIRTLLAKDGLAHVQAGAGIVIDSDPEAEFRESLKKAEALWRAFEMSEAEA
ncbi:aminodeoxychorismate synthase component I [Bacillaceae bacterium]